MRVCEISLGESILVVKCMNRCNLNYIIAALVVIAATCTLGCSSKAEPADLTAATASNLIMQKWSRDELNHYAVTFHSDDLTECGVKNDLWKLVDVQDRGYQWTAYQLTPKGNNVLFAIDLKGSGKGHVITLRGPYRLEITSITPGAEPDSRRVDFHWEIAWDKAPAGLKACIPKFELGGYEVGIFKLYGQEWRFVSYSTPEDAPPAPPGGPAPAPSLDKPLGQ